MVDATVTLYKDIGLDSNFNRTMYFTSKSQQTTWFNNIPANQRTTLTDVNYNKVQNSFYIHEQLGDVYGYTYVRLQDIDESGRTYYGFISNVTLVDDETARFDIVIDVIQTFMTEWELGECMVAREHVDRWDTTYPKIRVLKEGAVGNSIVNTDSNLDQSPVTIDDPTVELAPEMATIVVIFTGEVYDPYEFSTTNTVTRVMYGVVPISLDSNYNIKTVFTSEGETLQYNSITAEDVINGSFMDKLGLNPDSVLGAYICNPFAIKFAGSQSGTDINGAYNSTGIVTIHLHEKLIDASYPVEAYINFTLETGMTCIQVLTEEQIQQCFNNSVGWHIQIDKPTKPASATATASDIYEPMLYMQPFRADYITDASYTPLINIPDQLRLTGKDGIEVSNLLKTSGVADYIYVEESKNGIVGASAMVPANTADILSDAWKSYCLTQRDSDRRMMWSNIISNTINNTVFMGYGGALVGSRSASGDWDDDDRRNTLLKRGVVGATSIAVGASLVTSVVQGYNMWVQQESKEQAIRNQPSTTTAQSDGVAIGLAPLKHVSTKMNDIDYNMAYDKFRKYGYMVNSVETPNIQSRYYYNYICTTNTTIKGSLPADIKQDLVNIFEKGITFFHADHCNTTEYPEYENIERSLI